MLIHPEFDPVAFWIGPIPFRWYGIMYILAFTFFVLLGKKQLKHSFRLCGVYKKDVDDLLMYGVLGVIIGGRLGYVIFYNISFFIQNPLEIFAVWHGGMSFHGGLFGVILSLIIFAKTRPNFGKRKLKTKKFWHRFILVCDFVAPLVPLGLFFGRIGNFINGELYGRVCSSHIPWSMIFPQSGLLEPRHPSQLYQALGEGFLLFIFLFIISKRNPDLGKLSAFFLIGYSAFRFTSEFFREPDYHLGLLIFNFSMGQLLCVPTIILGFVILVFSNNNSRKKL